MHFPAASSSHHVVLLSSSISLVLLSLSFCSNLLPPPPSHDQHNIQLNLSLFFDLSHPLIQEYCTLFLLFFHSLLFRRKIYQSFPVLFLPSFLEGKNKILGLVFFPSGFFAFTSPAASSSSCLFLSSFILFRLERRTKFFLFSLSRKILFRAFFLYTPSKIVTWIPLSVCLLHQTSSHLILYRTQLTQKETDTAIPWFQGRGWRKERSSFFIISFVSSFLGLPCCLPWISLPHDKVLCWEEQ